MKGLKEHNLLRLDKIVSVLRKIAFVLIIAFTIVSIIGGIVMCTVDYLLAYGLALLFGGVIVGIITFFITKLLFFVINTWIDSLYDIVRLRKNCCAPIGEDRDDKYSDDEIEKSSVHVYVIKPINRDVYFVGVRDGVGLVADNVYAARKYPNASDAESYCKKVNLKNYEIVDYKLDLSINRYYIKNRYRMTYLVGFDGAVETGREFEWTDEYYLGMSFNSEELYENYIEKYALNDYSSDWSLVRK